MKVKFCLDSVRAGRCRLGLVDRVREVLELVAGGQQGCGAGPKIEDSGSISAPETFFSSYTIGQNIISDAIFINSLNF